MGKKTVTKVRKPAPTTAPAHGSGAGSLSPRTDTPCPNGPCVYILKCGDGSLYTGWTNHFEKRLAAHRSGTGAKYTRGRGPLTPFYLEYMPDKSSALRREAAIKKLPREKKLLLRYSPLNALEKQGK